MKILRVLRRRKIRLSFIFILLLIFIVNSYAWISYDRSVGTGALVAHVSSWGVEFIIEDEDEKVEEYTYEIEEFHPGIDPIQKNIAVYNVGEANSRLKYRIKEIYLYGEQILKNGTTEDDEVPETVGQEITDETDGYTTVNVFGNQNATIFKTNNTYSFSLQYPTPFTISYRYEKDYIFGMNGVETSKGNVNINLSWDNNEENNVEDTKLGNLAYNFKQNNPDEPAVKIIFEVIARRDKT